MIHEFFLVTAVIVFELADHANPAWIISLSWLLIFGYLGTWLSRVRDDYVQTHGL